MTIRAAVDCCFWPENAPVVTASVRQQHASLLVPVGFLHVGHDGGFGHHPASDGVSVDAMHLLCAIGHGRSASWTRLVMVVTWWHKIQHQIRSSVFKINFKLEMWILHLSFNLNFQIFSPSHCTIHKEGQGQSRATLPLNMTPAYHIFIYNRVSYFSCIFLIMYFWSSIYLCFPTHAVLYLIKYI